MARPGVSRNSIAKGTLRVASESQAHSGLYRRGFRFSSRRVDDASLTSDGQSMKQSVRERSGLRPGRRKTIEHPDERDLETCFDLPARADFEYDARRRHSER